MKKFEAPSVYSRNTVKVKKAGVENTGSTLMEIAVTKMGLSSLKNVNILDVGCGVRFTQTIINGSKEIGSYTGIDVNKPLIDYLQQNVEDIRFSFHHWNVKNERYNYGGDVLQPTSSLPVGAATFDVIWLFSVFTHMNPEDSKNMLLVLRKYIRPGGKLFFSALINNDLDTFEDQFEDSPMERAYYNENYLIGLIKGAGWDVLSSSEKDLDNFLQHHFVCQ